MACNSCAKSFSLLRTEKGCPGCGFSYCSKCLDNKIFLTKLNAEAKVCAKCKRAASAPNESKEIQPPDAYYKRLGVLENNSDNVASKDPKDQQIWERLQKLKSDKTASSSTTGEEEIRKRLQNIKGDTPSTSDAEIQTRLAKLRGLPIEELTDKPVLPPPDTRSDQKQIDDLMKQYMEQTKIDSNYKNEFHALIGDIESRMQRLKGANTSGGVNKIEEDQSEDDEEVVNKIVQKIKAEASLEDEILQPTNDELPFCEICNEDARMRCLGCRYLFCKRCFLEHKDDDDGCDRYETYEPPNGQQ